MNSKVLRGLCESYQDIYDDGFESWVESLLDEGYDLSDYTWDEMYESYIEEQRLSGADRRVQQSSLRAQGGPIGQRRAAVQASGGPRGQGNNILRRPGDPARTSQQTTRIQRTTPSPAVKPPAPAPKPPAPAPKPQASRPPAPTATKPPAPSGPKVAPKPATSSASQPPKRTFNPLMQKTFGYQTGYAPDQIKNNPKKMAQTGSLRGISSSFEWGSASKVVDDIANAYSSIYEAKKKDQDQDGDNDFADVQIARMIASGMSRAEAIAAVKNKSYNEEYGIKVPAGASDAQALKGLIPKGSKVHEMKKKKPTLQNASYEPEADMVDEATRMRKELGKEGETSTRKELAARSRGFKRSGSVDKTIAAAERRADWTGDEKKAKTLRKLASSRRGSVRDKPRVQLRGYAAKVEGPDKELQTSRQRAMSAGTLTPKEKKQLGEEFYMWVEALIDEGYDLSEYTWDEMYEIYEETEKEREERLAKRRARVREMESQGRVMTSSRRTSERAKQRREEQRAERLERLANKALADTVGTTRRSSKPMGSEAPEPKEAAPAANRKLAKTTKRDTLASRADEILRMIQNEDFELWLEDLIEEGYELSDWTDGEIIDLYMEIENERYS